jgi:glycine/D-amino acid oxidase-like deaminating enzyme/nitrite reductase/ring-hydroxylating ferredoxin subunit
MGRKDNLSGNFPYWHPIWAFMQATPRGGMCKNRPGQLKKDFMKRDGENTSLWQDTAAGHDRKQVATRDVFDVLIVGAGITGISTGLLLQKAGKSVMIAEAKNIGFGTTGGTTAHLNSFTETPFNDIIKNFGEDNAKLAARGLRQAMELIKNHVQAYNIDCGYKELPGYLYARDEKESKVLEEILEGAKKAGVDVDYCNSSPVNIPFAKVIEFRKQGQIHPTRYIQALANEFEKAGGVLQENCRVTAVDEAEVLSVDTSTGNYKARNLVYATHVPPGVNLLHFRCAPYRSYVIAAKLKNEADYPDALAYDMDDPYRYYRTEEVDGEKYFIAGGEDHKTGHEENTEACFTRLEAYVRKYYDIEKIAYRWSSQFFDPADGLPYIGHLPGHASNMFVATGYGGIGITQSSLAAMILTDLSVSGESEYRKLYHPGRVKPVAGFSNFVKEAADVVTHFIGDKLSIEKIGSLAELAPGEAKVVKYEGHTLALYKDEGGHLHAVNSACTHIKCTVGWNATEKSWDCPCHGSRFSYDGELLTAPARKDLELIHLEELVEH